MSLWSTHGIKYRNELWPNCAHAWYGTRYSKKPNRSKSGALAVKNYSKDSEDQNEQLLNILEDILLTKLNTHPILKLYLSDTADAELKFIVSKYDTNERKWLGFVPETETGDNMLGKLWMKLRKAL
jgi:predicted NAD-dependent protein-ADP-ribosyltransferase YbiA (DUF1768 family)